MPVKGSCQDPVIRFWAYVDVSAGPDGCWLWTGAINPRGYGQFTRSHNHTVRAHRFSYEIHIGAIPPGYHVDHVKDRGCTNRHCVNPAHLEAVTPRENILRSANQTARNAVKTHCDKGHEFTSENTYTYNGFRGCRQCRRVHVTTYRRRKRAKARGIAA